MEIRTRIAPSPTGIAHVGTMYTALINFAFAKSHKGKFILRIEDTDRNRYVSGTEKIIFNSLKWLGINYDEGPDIGGPYSPYTQSKRLRIYKTYAEELIKKGKAYYCFCSSERLAAMRKAQQNQGKLPKYDGTCRKLNFKESLSRIKKEKFVIRLKVSSTGVTSWKDLIRGKVSFENKNIDDQVLLKSDGYPTYHLAVVVDDHLMKISHVIRAEEWISSTPKHILLYKSFGWELPKFSHTPLLRNPDRSKLSKRKNPVSVIWYKERGFLPEVLVNYLSLMGWSHPEGEEIFSLEEFIKHFSLNRIQTSQPIFDLEKLKWMNGVYLRKMSNKKLLQLIKPFVSKKAKSNKLEKILPLVKERIHTLEEFNDYAQFFFEKPEIDKHLLQKQSKKDSKIICNKLKTYLTEVKKISSENFTTKKIEKISRELVDKNWNTKKLFMTLRVAISGKTISPPLFESMEILGKDETIKRIEYASELLQ